MLHLTISGYSVFMHLILCSTPLSLFPYAQPLLNTILYYKAEYLLGQVPVPCLWSLESSVCSLAI